MTTDHTPPSEVPPPPEGTALIDIECYLGADGYIAARGHNHMGRQAFFHCSHRALGDGLFEIVIASRWIMRGREEDGKLICEPQPPRPEPPPEGT